VSELQVLSIGWPDCTYHPCYRSINQSGLQKIKLLNTKDQLRFPKATRGAYCLTQHQESNGLSPQGRAMTASHLTLLLDPAFLPVADSNLHPFPVVITVNTQLSVCSVSPASNLSNLRVLGKFLDLQLIPEGELSDCALCGRLTLAAGLKLLHNISAF
jgi:hypothetical protein